MQPSDWLNVSLMFLQFLFLLPRPQDEHKTSVQQIATEEGSV